MYGEWIPKRGAWYAIEPYLRCGHRCHVDWMGYVTLIGPAVTPCITKWIAEHNDAVRQALEEKAAEGRLRRIDD